MQFSDVRGAVGIAEQFSDVLGAVGMADRDSAVVGGGGIAVQLSDVRGAVGMAEHDTEVLGGGGIAEHSRSVLGGGGITGPGRVTSISPMLRLPDGSVTAAAEKFSRHRIEDRSGYAITRVVRSRRWRWVPWWMRAPWCAWCVKSV